MQLRFTRGVGVALAIAVGCAVLGFVMAPGWWAFAAFSAWWGIILMAGGRSDNGDAMLSLDRGSQGMSATEIPSIPYHETSFRNVHYRLRGIGDS